MKPRCVKPLTRDELTKLTTPRLLSYLKQLNRCEASLEASDFSPNEIAQADAIVFKSSEAWQAQYNLVKAVLATREHVEK